MEIGKKDILERNDLPMFMFKKNVSFAAVDVSQISQDRPHLAGQAMAQIMELVRQGQFQPAYPLQLYGVSEVQKAFRTMQSGKTTGKIAVELRPSDEVEARLETKASLSLIRPQPTSSPVVWVAWEGASPTGSSSGARNLILLSRSGGDRDAHTREFLAELNRKGARVAAPPCDVSDEAILRATLDQCLSSMPAERLHPGIDGVTRYRLRSHDIRHLADRGATSKSPGSWNLHAALPKGMDFFIMFASMAGVCGSRGQANYAAATRSRTPLLGTVSRRVSEPPRWTWGLSMMLGYMADKTSLQTLYGGLAKGL